MRPTGGGAAIDTAAGRVACAVGAIYMLAGIVGFAFVAFGGSHLLLFMITPLHNLAHFALGALLVVGASRGEEAAKQAMLVVGSVFLLLSVFGPLLMDMPMNMLGLNAADHVLHGLTAVVLIGAPVLLGRRRPQEQ